MLHAGAAGRPYSSKLRLALCSLYSLLSNPTSAAAHLEKLDIKHIQLDTLSPQHALPALRGFGRPEGGKALLNDILELYDDHRKDRGDTIFMAYQHCSYTKVCHNGPKLDME